MGRIECVLSGNVWLMNGLRVFAGLALVATAAISSASTRITTYDALVKALKNGEHVRIVVEYAKTKLQVAGKDSPSPDAWGGLEVTTWDKFAKGQVGNDKEFVGITHSALTQHPAFGYITNFVRFKFDPDGSVSINTRYVRPGPTEPLSDQLFTSKLSNGKDKNAVSVFVG